MSNPQQSSASTDQSQKPSSTAPSAQSGTQSNARILKVARLRKPRAKGDAEKQIPYSGDTYHEPERTHPGDAGLDLFTVHSQVIPKSQTARLPHNMAVAIPDGFFGMIVGRSSTLQEKNLLVVPGIIDSGFRGEVQTVVVNIHPHLSARVYENERLSQLLILPLVKVQVQPVAEAKDLPEGLDDSRGEAGFGSSGGFTKREQPGY